MQASLHGSDNSVYMKNSMFRADKPCKDLILSNLTISLEKDLIFVIPDHFWKKDQPDGTCKILLT